MQPMVKTTLQLRISILLQAYMRWFRESKFQGSKISLPINYKSRKQATFLPEFPKFLEKETQHKKRLRSSKNTYVTLSPLSWARRLKSTLSKLISKRTMTWWRQTKYMKKRVKWSKKWCLWMWKKQIKFSPHLFNIFSVIHRFKWLFKEVKRFRL